MILMGAGFTEKRARRFGSYRRRVYAEVIEALQIEQALQDIRAHTIPRLDKEGYGSAIADLRASEDHLMGIERHEKAKAAIKKAQEESGETWDALNEFQPPIPLTDEQQKRNSARLASNFAAARSVTEQLQNGD